MYEDIGNFLKNIRSIHTKCIILKLLYLQNITENKVGLKRGEDGLSIIQK